MTDLTAAGPAAHASIGIIASTDDTGSSATTTVATRSRYIVGTANSQDTTNTSSPSQPNIRHRTRAGVPPLDFALPACQQPDPLHVIFDRLHYHVEVPVAFSGRELLEEFVQLLVDTDIHDHPLFTGQPTISSAGPLRLKLRVADGWHVTGTVEFRLNQSLVGLLAIDLDLNFSRWAGALQNPDPEVIEVIAATALLRKTDIRFAGTLDGKDNVLPYRDRVGSPTAEPRVRLSVELMEIYLRKVDELLNHFLAPNPELPTAEGIRTVRLGGPSSAEAYLEFYSDDAISTVERLREAAISGMSNPEWRYFRIPSVDGAMARNSPSLTFSLTKSIRVAIYAKHAKTVRVEVRYLKNVRDQAFHRSARGGSRTPSSVLDELRHDAAKRIKDVLSAFATHLRPDLGRTTGLELFQAIQIACGSETGRAGALLSAIINLGGITETAEESIAPPNVVRSLVRAGVLQRVHYRHGNADVIDGRRYALTPAFAAAAHRIRSS